MADDLGLLVISPSIGLDRNSTPVRLPVRTSHTPPRNSSNPRNGGSAMRKRLLLSADKPDAEVADRGQARSMSRRKQRRWENKNLFGVEQLLSILADNEAEEDGLPKANFGPKIEWRSAFQELFEPNNRDALETFRQCGEHFSSHNYPKQRLFTSQAEVSWFNVEKKLRVATTSFLKENPVQLFPFLGALEDNLKHFALTKEILPHESDSRLLTSYLASPMAVDSTGVLHIFLRDFKGNRHLLHAVCQFYGLQSKSYKKKGSNNKVTAVVAPRHPSNVARRQLSLTKYLLMEHFQHSEAVSLDLLADDDNVSSSEVEDLGDILQDVL
eukprot:gene2098-2292_t